MAFRGIKAGGRAIEETRIVKVTVKAEELAEAGYDISRYSGRIRKAMIGQDVHKFIQGTFKEADDAWQIERRVTGGRIDLLHMTQGIIIEIKPNNERAIKQGLNQLSRYKNKLQCENYTEILMLYTVE